MPTSRPLRHRCELFALLAAAPQAPANVRVLELSEVGAFVAEEPSLRGLQVGDGAVLMLALPGGDPLEAHCVVSRFGTSRQEVKHASVDHLTLSAQGFAVEFDDLPEDEMERLRDYIELLDNR